jgi:hypothetical protein
MKATTKLIFLYRTLSIKVTAQEKTKEAVAANYQKHKEHYKQLAATNYQNNKDRLSLRSKERREANKDYYLAKEKIQRQNNKAYFKTYRKQHHEQHKEYCRLYYQQKLKGKENKKAKEINRKCYQRNKEEITQRIRYRRLTDPIFRLKCRLRTAVRRSFKQIKQNKPAHTEQLLGCSWVKAETHIETLFKPGMTWENMGEWHIDHKKPLCLFTETDMHLANHISNLQPLWALENLQKNRFYDCDPASKGST